MKKKYLKPGFTLVELILVITVTIILMGTAITSLIRSQRTFVFNGAFQEIQTIVREARSFAVTGKAQPDFTDYDGDACKNANGHDPDCGLSDSEDDLVTPANYGVFFDVTGRKVVLFADVHGTAGQFNEPDSGTGIGKYEDGKDVILKVFHLPASLDLIVQPDSGGKNAVFFSPIYADVTFKTEPADFFVFGLKEKATVGNRANCIVMHAVSGVPEEMGKVEDATLTCENN
jgi:type II secretory pathway pseudopilin PulG